MNGLSAELKTVARKFYRAIGTPLALRLERALHNGEWDLIANAKVSARDYISPQEYFLDASAASLLRKCSALPVETDRKGSALKNWIAGEQACYRTNERLSPYLEGVSHPDWNGDVAQHIAELRKKVAVVLGVCPAMDDLHPRHGPGATFSDPAKRSTVADKMERTSSLTHNALWFLLDWVGTAWGREALRREVYPSMVRGNRFSTAPKDALNDRPIAAEPSINVFYQLGLGRAVRSRLKRWGIDLDVGQEVHRQAACEASISGSCCTLDMSNASDTVAYNLVKLLLPPKWFRLFDELRSPFTRFSTEDAAKLLGRQPGTDGDHWVKLEKFSSMGNGFTFELETLLFYVIADYATSVAVGDAMDKKPTLVYGDDIICDSRGAENVVALLRFLGFTLNDEKSFIGGPFRESCGGDFWAGRPVRPVYLKGDVSEPQQLIATANQVRRLAQDLFGGLGPLASTWLSVQDFLPSRVRRCRGPERLGDIVIHDLEETWNLASGRILAYAPVKHREVHLSSFSEGTVHACGLYGLLVSEGVITPRDSVSGYGFKRVYPLKSDWLPSVAIRPSWDIPIAPAHHGPSGPKYARVKHVVRGGVVYDMVWCEPAAS